MISIIVAWILVTLASAGAIGYIGKRFGVGIVIGSFAGIIVMSQVLANKIVVFGPYTVPAAVIAYATSFLLTDILCEFYGKKKAREAVWGGFIASILLVLGIQIASSWPAAPFWQGQEAFESTLGMTWRIVIASLVAYIISQNWDVYVFHRIKDRTKGKHLWARNNISTMSSQSIDTVIFITIAFYGVFPVLPMIVGQFIIKLLISLLDTPFIYTLKLILKPDPSKES